MVGKVDVIDENPLFHDIIIIIIRLYIFTMYLNNMCFDLQYLLAIQLQQSIV